MFKTCRLILISSLKPLYYLDKCYLKNAHRNPFTVHIVMSSENILNIGIYCLLCYYQKLVSYNGSHFDYCAQILNSLGTTDLFYSFIVSSKTDDWI